MTFDPNDRLTRDPLKDPSDPRNAGYQNNVEVRNSSSWMAWVAVIAVILVGAFVWSQMGGSTTDPQTTSSTTAPATDTAKPAAPAPAPATPAPPAANPSPATPPAGGAQPARP